MECPQTTLSLSLKGWLYKTLHRHDESHRTASEQHLDLQGLDARLRTLSNTTAGAQCQNLLTTEYQAWRLKVGLILQSADGTASGLPTASGLSPECLEAFLHGFRLQFSPPTCVIVPCAPSLASATGLCKRKAVKISEVLESRDI